MRFNHDAESFAEARKYLLARAKQLLRFGVLLDKVYKVKGGDAFALFYIGGLKGKKYSAIYILKQNRGKGAYFKAREAIREKYGDAYDTVLTTPDCNLEGFLSANDIPHLVLDPNTLNGKPFPEYEIISEFWDDKVAKRSGVHYMNHVDEGLRVLVDRGASERAMRIFALHGLLQQCYRDDTVFTPDLSRVAPDVLIGTMEYRAVANAHLSFHPPETLRLSEDGDVNEALVADKIQNFKDFLRYHSLRHDRTVELGEYFAYWLRKLGLDIEEQWRLQKPLSFIRDSENRT